MMTYLEAVDMVRNYGINVCGAYSYHVESRELLQIIATAINRGFNRDIADIATLDRAGPHLVIKEAKHGQPDDDLWIKIVCCSIKDDPIKHISAQSTTVLFRQRDIAKFPGKEKTICQAYLYLD